MTPLELSTIELLQIHEWCEAAETERQVAAHKAQKNRQWERCAEQTELIVRYHSLKNKILNELAVRGTHPVSPSTSH